MKQLIVIATILLTFGDANGQIKNEVNIGEQVWMKTELSVVKFRNGDKIKQAQSAKDWNSAIQNKMPAWCYYSESKIDATVKFPKGILYNWYAVSDARGLAPNGWRIPTVRDFEYVSSIFGGEDSVGLHIKSSSGWDDNLNGNDISGFSAYPRGVRNGGDFSFEGKGRYIYWWTSERGKCVGLDYTANSLKSLQSKDSDFDFGYSVRCIKNNPEVIIIGKQKWNSVDLRLTKFRNGDSISKVHTKEQWQNACKNKIPAFMSTYNMSDDQLNAFNLGYVYNIYALNDSRMIAPYGFHVASKEEWDDLSTFLGGDSLAYKHLSKSSYYWSGSPGLSKDGEFLGDGLFIAWWTSSITEDNKRFIRVLNYYDSDFATQKEETIDVGFAIRCIKDE